MIGEIISGVAPILGGIIGDAVASGDRDRAMQLIQDEVNKINQIQIPEERALRLQELKSIGELTPEMQQVIKQGETELKKITVDPRYLEAQNRALSQLQEIGEGGGLTAQDRAQLAEIQSQESAAARGARDAALMNAQERGIGGSGSELAQTLAANQAAADRSSKRGMDVAALAQQRALDAISRSGELGGSIGAQQFGQQSQVAGAQDVINRFNTAAMSDVAKSNIAAKNAAQAANLENAQRIADQNVGLSNQAILYNQQAAQRAYENQLNKAKASVAAASGLAQQYSGAADKNAAMWSGIGSGVGKTAAALSMDSNAKALQKKKDAEELDA